MYYGLATTVGISFVTETVGFILVQDNGNGLVSSFSEADIGSQNDSAAGGGIMSQNKDKIRILLILNSNNSNSNNGNTTTLSIDTVRRVI